MPDARTVLAERLQAAFDTLEPGADPVLRSSDRADFQANGALALAKRLGRDPREVAAEVVAAADLADVCAGGRGQRPGIHQPDAVRPGSSPDQVAAVAADDRLGVDRALRGRDGGGRLLGPQRGQGDARRATCASTIIGDALCRMLDLRRAPGPAGEPHRRLGDALRDAHRAPGRPGRGGGGPRAVGRRPRRLLPAGPAVLRRRAPIPGAQPAPGGAAPVGRPRDPAAVAGAGGRERALLRRGLRQARRAADRRRHRRRELLQPDACRGGRRPRRRWACWWRATAPAASSRPGSPTATASPSR